MIQKIRELWSWFIDGLTDATMACADATSKRPTIEMLLGIEPIILRESAHKDLGRIVQLSQPVRTEPPDLRNKIGGMQLDIVVPEAFVLHRNLNPLPAESVPFLDAFVRHQIERITPWKAADTYFGVSTAKMAGKPAKLAISVHVVARRLVDEAISAARQLNPAVLRLVLPAQDNGAVAIAIGGDRNAHRVKIRAIVQAGAAAAILLIIGRLAFFPTQMAAVQSQTADVDSQIEDQQTALSELRGGPGHFTAGDLFAMREARPRVVETLEALSAALPDDDYLTSIELTNEDLHISGISTKTADLVPTLEGSRRFRDVSFVEPITRVQGGDGNKFHLSMRIATPDKVMRQ